MFIRLVERCRRNRIFDNLNTYAEPVIFIEVVFRVSVGPSDAVISPFCAGDEVWDDGKQAARVAAGPVGLFVGAYVAVFCEHAACVIGARGRLYRV